MYYVYTNMLLRDMFLIMTYSSMSSWTWWLTCLSYRHLS